LLERERERVAAAARRLAAEGLVVGTAGNVSERREELVAITPAGAVLENVHPDAITVVDLAGRHLEGNAASSELGLHLGVYQIGRAHV
jgi:L-fuculose-phosphate aldolase